MSRFALGLAALTLVLVTGACEDDPEPKIAEPTEEPTSETTSDPPSSSPPSSSTPVRLSPEATVRAWIDGLSTAFESGSFTDVEAVSGARCKTCKQFIDPVFETYDSGGSYRTRPIRIVSLKAKPEQKSVVDVALVFPAGVLIESSGATPTRFGSSKEILEFEVAAEGATNVVTSVVFLS